MTDKEDNEELYPAPVRHPSESGRNPESQRVLIVVAVVSAFVIALLAIGIWAWRHKKSSDEGEGANVAPTVSVTVAKAERGEISNEVSALGTIFPRDQATVSTKVSAQISKMGILKNRYVKAGDVIAVLESRDLRAQRSEAAAALNEARASEKGISGGTIPQTNAQDQKALRDARANVAAARATYERRKVLFDQGGISKKDLETSQVALVTAESDLSLAEQTINLRLRAMNPNDRAVAESKVSQAEQHLAGLDAQLSYATIRAPISGIVTDQFQFDGEFEASGAKLVTIADTSEVIVKAPFADNVAADLKVGDEASVVPTDSPDNKMTGKITLVSRSADPSNRTVEVWVTLGNESGKLKANGAANLTVSSETATDAVVVPISAVTLEATNADEGTVMVVDARMTAHEQKVTVGIRSSDKIEIKSGLKGGETIVTEGNYELPDGTKVEIAQPKADEDDTKGKSGEKSDSKGKSGEGGEP